MEKDEACLVVLARPVRFDGDARAMKFGDGIAGEQEGRVGHVAGRGLPPEVGVGRSAEVEWPVCVWGFLHGLLVRVRVEELVCALAHVQRFVIG